VLAAAEGLNDVFAHDDIIDYVSAIIEETRQHGEVLLGASPRAGIHLLKVAKGYAAISGRNYVLPDDVKKAAVPVLAHRLMLTSAARVKSAMDVAVVREVLQRVPVPTESVFDGR